MSLKKFKKPINPLHLDHANLYSWLQSNEIIIMDIESIEAHYMVFHRAKHKTYVY